MNKEIKETVRNPRFLVFTILLPLILYPIMGFIIVGAMSSASEKVQSGLIAVIDEDKTDASSTLVHFLKSSGMNVVFSNKNILENIPRNILAIIEIPSGFSHSLGTDSSPNITVYTVLQGINIGDQSVMGIVTSVLDSYKDYLKSYIASKHGLNPDIISNPVREEVHILVRSWGREFNPGELNTLLMQVMFWPWLIFSLVISVVQLSATFLSEEKEQKTLEILLTLPVKRTIILFSKVLGSGLLAILGTVSYTIGFIIYIDAFSRYMHSMGVELAFPTNPLLIILMGIIFFLSLLFSAALGLSVSVLAQDTKSAESLASTIIFPVMIIAFIIMFFDISSLPLYAKIIIYLIPYTYLMEGIKYIFMGRIELFLVGIAINLAGAFIMLSLVSKIFTTERILTMKVKLRGKRSKGFRNREY